MKEIIADQRLAEDDGITFLWECYVGERYESNEYCFAHGNTPTIDIKSKKPARIEYYENTIKVDCGAAFSQYGGCLTALCLDDGMELYQ